MCLLETKPVFVWSYFQVKYDFQDENNKNQTICLLFPAMIVSMNLGEWDAKVRQTNVSCRSQLYSEDQAG